MAGLTSLYPWQCRGMLLRIYLLCTLLMGLPPGERHCSFNAGGNKRSLAKEWLYRMPTIGKKKQVQPCVILNYALRFNICHPSKNLLSWDLLLVSIPDRVLSWWCRQRGLQGRDVSTHLRRRSWLYRPWLSGQVCQTHLFQTKDLLTIIHYSDVPIVCT